MPQLLSYPEFIAFAAKPGCTVYSLSGKKVETRYVQRNVAYILHSEKEQTAKRITVLDR
jgi:hypothetical protein